MTETKTHDYTRRTFGHDFAITKIFEGGMRVSMMGWGRGISKGDFMILPDGHGTTRYQIASIRYYDNPSDMWRATAEFAPRARLARDVMQEKENTQCP